MKSSHQRLGIDLGGTKIEGILMSPDGDILQKHRLPTPADGYEPTLGRIARVVNALTDDPDLPVGIGTPGSVSRLSPLMRNANSTCLNGKPLQQDLEHLLQRQVRLANDADCFALSEASDGAASEAKVVFGVILGTGVGGGICINGQLLAGVNGIAGEWGHNRLPAQPGPNRTCYCGRLNCVETWLSGPGLSQSFEEQTGREIAAEEIAALASSGDEQALRVLEAFCEKLGAALASVVNIIDPDVIVLGGGLSNIERLYDRLPRTMKPYVFSDHVDTQVVPARFGDASGVRGAAWLWP